MPIARHCVERESQSSLPLCPEVDHQVTQGERPRLENVAATHPHHLVRAPRLVVGLATSSAGIAAWWASGYAVAVPITIVTLLTLLAAIVDFRIARLPNVASATAFAVALISVPLVASLDDRPVAATAVGALAGVAYSGAPVLFLIWLVRPASIGGGDWKMLGAVGAGIGLVLPIAALVMTTVACVIQITVGAARRIRTMPFGPSIAAALIIILCLLPTLVHIFGGPYA